MKSRKIIHVDMDCFYAAVEVRDNPALKNRPVAIGGLANRRGVLSTCNYEARKYGLRSAMPTAQALKLCPKVVLLPGNMNKYKAASKVIHRIFKQYTPLVEMLSLDEAFLDVTDCEYCKGSATLIAKTIKNRIKKELNLTASAGVASNKFLAKVASDWDKPDGLYVIKPDEIDDFVKKLPVTKIFGVGKVTAEKMDSMQIKNCLDLQQLSFLELTSRFGKMGGRFYDLCRGIDDRKVEAERLRKSFSIERTFPVDLKNMEDCNREMKALIGKFKKRFNVDDQLSFGKLFVKVKFYDFKVTTAEVITDHFDENLVFELLKKAFDRQQKAVRLIGVGVKKRFC